MGANESATKHTTAKIPNKQKIARIKLMAKQGRSLRDIAVVTGYTHATIGKYLQRIEDAKAPIKYAQEHTEDMLFDNFTLSSSNLSSLLLEQAERDVSTLTPTELVRASECQSKITSFLYTQYRLAAGKSTSNSSHHIQINAIHKALDFSKPSASASGEGPHQSPTPYLSQACCDSQTYGRVP